MRYCKAPDPPPKRQAAPANRGGEQLRSGAASLVSEYQSGFDDATPPDDGFPALWCCDGLAVIGRIYHTGGQYRAVMDDGRRLGIFATAKLAKAGILDTAKAKSASHLGGAA